MVRVYNRQTHLLFSLVMRISCSCCGIKTKKQLTRSAVCTVYIMLWSFTLKLKVLLFEYMANKVIEIANYELLIL